MSQAIVRQNLLKILVSIYLVWHMAVIVVCPNPESVLFRNSAQTIVTYGNVFGLNTTWRFFSPTPAVRLIDYEVFKRIDGEFKSEKFSYPMSPKDEGYRELYNRKVNNGMYVMARGLISETLGPYLCRKHNGAESIAIYIKGRTLPTLEKSKFMGNGVDSIGEQHRDYFGDINCERVNDATH